MGLRIISALRTPIGTVLELAARRALDGFSGELDVCITPAMDAAHAEIVISENGVWRASYYATLDMEADHHVRRIRHAFQTANVTSRTP